MVDGNLPGSGRVGSTAGEPRLLVLETSSRVAQVGLAEGPALVALRTLDEARRHARDLAPAVAALLSERSWRPRDVQGIVVSQGPGSYTGLRVGIMSAKAFAYATGCVVVAVETFAALAAQAPEDIVQLLVIADAQQEKVYAQRFERTAVDARLQAVTPLCIRALSEWLPQMKEPIAVTGPGLRAYRDRLPGDVRVLDRALWEPRLESLLTLGLAQYRDGSRADLDLLEPLYLRPSAAEEQLGRRSVT